MVKKLGFWGKSLGGWGSNIGGDVWAIIGGWGSNIVGMYPPSPGICSPGSVYCVCIS